MQPDPPSKYYLSRKACLGILRRAEERGKALPPALEAALHIQAGLDSPQSIQESPAAFAVNQRDEVRDLHDVAGALTAEPGMKQQTFVTAAFVAKAGSKARGIGYSEEAAPTLTAGGSGTNRAPAVLCLNDQGGSRFGTGQEVSGTLRAQDHGHTPVVLYENHGIDGRYTGPSRVAPTMTARYGTGGNNMPLIGQEDAFFPRQRTDRFRETNVASTESARQGKDATDLVLQTAEDKGPARRLIRRLMPVECERLQGFPDGWTTLEGASDSARYRALGNSVAIPCVEYLMEGIAAVLKAALEVS